MKKTLLLITCLVLISAANSSFTEEEYNELQKKATFKTMSYTEYNAKFKNVNYSKPNTEEIQKRYQEALKRNSKNRNLKSEFEYISNDYDEKEDYEIDIPTEFSWLREKPECFTQKLKDQGSCNASSVFAATYVLAKRFCILDSKKYSKLDLSPQDVISCGELRSCEINPSITPYTHLRDKGACEETCFPYSSWKIWKYESIPKCSNQCKDYRLSKILYKSEENYSREDDSKNPVHVLEEILKNGPASTTLYVDNDFKSYKGGIYVPVEKKKISDLEHEVAIVGWGVDSKHGRYFIGANSWGTNWGEDGYFKIPFNYNEGSIFTHTFIAFPKPLLPN